MKRFTAAMAIGAAVLHGGTAFAQPAAKPDVAREEALRLVDAWFEAQRAYDHVPALSAGVVAGDRLVWAKGYGTIDTEGRIAATPSTIYSICSISKLFTSVALMQESDAGRLQLDAPITTYLPWADIRQTSASSGPITMRGILSHSAGLPREAAFRYWAPPEFSFPTAEQVRQTVGKQETLFGTYRHYQYSNLGLTLAGQSLETIAQKPYAEIIESRILAPLGMTDTREGLPMELYGSRLAAAHGAINRDGSRDVLRSFDTKGVSPAAGLTSTVEDLAKFASWQFRLLKSGQTELLKSSTLEEMQRVQFLDPDWQTARGLGFGIYRKGDRTLVGHRGECPGYYTSMMLDRSNETAVIVMMNAAQPTNPYVNGVFDILGKRRNFSFSGTAPAKIDLEDYAGRYSEQPWGSESIYVPWAGGLAYLAVPSQSPLDDMSFLKPVARDVFRRIRADGTDADEIRFERDSTGKVARVVIFNNPNPKID
jgi:CubicO group peptidase (beta-lactamase class C family)